MGRYLGFRLHPFSLGEMISNKTKTPEEVKKLIEEDLRLSSAKNIHNSWDDLTNYGGFPEPLLSGSHKTHNLWQRGRLEKIVREDLRDLSRIMDLSKIEMLISLLPESASHTLSINSLREDLETDYKSMKRWLESLKQLYYYFEIKPWSKNIKRAIKKERKVYLWDWSEIKDKGARFENMVASHLLKACHYWTDTGEGNFDLHYFKTKEKKEVDFLITKDSTPWLPIECKIRKESISPYFFKVFPELKTFYQLVDKKNYLKKKNEKQRSVFIVTANQFFRHFP